METKTKNKNNKGSDWKKIVQVFIGDILERVEDNLNHKFQNILNKIKRKALASLLIANGLIFLLIGVVIYVSAMLDPVLPGLGYMTVGLVVIFIGYLINKD